MTDKFSKEINKRLIIHYQDSINERIESDKLFSKFIEQTEFGLKEFAEIHDIDLLCYFYFEQDFEITDWIT